jgi:hypothetical protein
VAQRWREAIARAAGSAVDEDIRPDEHLGHITLDGVSTTALLDVNIAVGSYQPH